VRADLTRFETVNFHFKVDGATEFAGGEAEVVETVDGEGGTAGDGLPVNRGKFRYFQTDTDVDLADVYETELEGVMANGKKTHWPNKKSMNDKLTIDPDISND
jgi:hypothetical protein